MIWLSILFGLGAILVFIGTRIYKGENEQEREEVRRSGGWISLVLCFLAFIFLIFASLTVIPPGHVGVQVIFGKVKKEIIPEGLHSKNPFASIKKMTIQTQSYTMSKIVEEGEKNDRPDAISALTKDNLTVEMDITVLYKLLPSSAPEVYRILGFTDVYTEKVVRPSIRTAIRNSVAKFNASEVMSERRREVERDIQEELVQILKEYFSERNMEEAIIIERVLLRNVEPPEKLKQAIQAKLEAEQEAQKMNFVLQKEKMEAERKRIEAQGIADAQRIIAQSLSKEYLQWYYIQGLRDLVNSPNNSTIILPFDQKLTPLLPIK